MGLEITELVGVVFSGNVRDIALGPAIFSRVFPKSGRSSGGDPRLTTPDRCASTADSQAVTQESSSLDKDSPDPRPRVVFKNRLRPCRPNVFAFVSDQFWLI